MKLNADSFYAKLFLNGIDKLVLALLLVLTLAVWTQYQRNYERAQMRADEVNSIKIQRPIALVEELSNLVRQCTLFMQRVSERPLQELNEKDREQFASLLLEISLNLEMVKSYSRDRAETTCAVERLLSTVREVEIALLKSRHIEFRRLHELRGELFQQFIQLSDSTVDETTASISISGARSTDVRECPILPDAPAS